MFLRIFQWARCSPIRGQTRRRRQTPKISRQILRSTRYENANAASSNGETRRELALGSVTEERPRKVLVGLTLGFSVANDEKSRRKKTGITCTFSEVWPESEQGDDSSWNHTGTFSHRILHMYPFPYISSPTDPLHVFSAQAWVFLARV